MSHFLIIKMRPLPHLPALVGHLWSIWLCLKERTGGLSGGSFSSSLQKRKGTRRQTGQWSKAQIQDASSHYHFPDLNSPSPICTARNQIIQTLEIEFSIPDPWEPPCLARAKRPATRRTSSSTLTATTAATKVSVRSTTNLVLFPFHPLDLLITVVPWASPVIFSVGLWDSDGVA